MELVLWRHAEAEDDAPNDLARNLTPRGKRQAKAMAEWFDLQISGRWEDWEIIVSPANRAQQTAGALGRAFRTEPEIAPDVGPENVLAAAGWNNPEQFESRGWSTARPAMSASKRAQCGGLRRANAMAWRKPC